MVKSKKCNICGETDQTKLVKDINRPLGFRNRCKSCRQKDVRGGKSKNAHLKRTYGITLEDFNRMLFNQNGCCLICKKQRTELLVMDIHVDHCHKTGKVRGLLCSSCNQGLGNFKDNIANLLAAVEYLKING